MITGENGLAVHPHPWTFLECLELEDCLPVYVSFLLLPVA